MRKYLIAVFAVFTFASCGGGQNEEEIKKVESILEQMSEASNRLDSINPKVFKPYKDSITFDVKFVQTEYADTMPLEMAITVDSYHRILKSISKFESTYTDQKKDIDYSLDQLQDMKKDLETEVLTKEAFEEFFPSEKEAAARLIESNGNMEIWFNSVFTSYEKRRGPVLDLMEEIKQRKGY